MRKASLDESMEFGKMENWEFVHDEYKERSSRGRPATDDSVV